MKSNEISENGLVLGIEGGGTKTTWALVDSSGRAVREGKAGPGNLGHMTDAEILALITAIAKSVGHAPVTAIGGAFAGCHRDSDQKKVTGYLRRFWPKAKPIFVGEDTLSAFAGAHGLGEGLIVIAGTGSNVQGYKAGRWEKAGGWGALCGDPGSSYDIARHGLQLAYRHFDETQKVGKLLRAFIAQAGCKDHVDFVRWTTELHGKTGIADLARSVFAAAKAGDALAKQVLAERAEALADCVAFVARRLKLQRPPLGIVGSALEKNPDYRKTFERAVRKRLPMGQIFLVDVPGAVGAARLVASSSKLKK